MRSTLFFIPHEFFGIPLFGWGWAVGLTLVAVAIWLIFQLLHKRSVAEIASSGTVWALMLALFLFVLPSVEQRWPDGTPIGLPIRGYGAMVLAGLLSGVTITSVRAAKLGVSTDLIVGLAVWTMLGGVIGARSFFVAQKWDSFHGQGMERLISILKITEGGLVIYGGIIGGLVAGSYYCYRYKLSPLATADLVVPGFLIGYSLGRIGCLLHGCCFGGVCTAELPTIRFPQGSLPYQAQLEDGQLLGIHLSSRRLPSIIQSVDAGSAAEQAGIHAGDELRLIRSAFVEPNKSASPTDAPEIMIELETDGGLKPIPSSLMPKRSLPVHPSQIYASINALLLCCLMWFWQPIPMRDGIVFCCGVILYAISRFLIEWIRSDESGQLGTSLSIAQLIAIGTGTAATVGLVYLLRHPQPRAWNWTPGETNVN